jgi:hypothetical protein
MAKILIYILVGAVVSGYFFSFGFTFLPPGINTKMILAVIGMPMAAFHAIRNRSLNIDKGLLGAIGLALLFSLVCFYAVDYNNKADYAYATYFVSFFVWLFSAYTVCALIHAVHGAINIRLLTTYLALVCTAQCFLALLIDNVPTIQHYVDLYIDQGQAFLTEVNRLYGIGAALDPAGVRFSITLLLIAAVLMKDNEVRNSKRYIASLWLCFFITLVVGNMISRTTLVGAILAALYLLWYSGLGKLQIRYGNPKMYSTFALIFIALLALTVYLYNTNDVFHSHLRFAFEGFFNWAETGEWRTDSTDKLDREMWVWPTDTKSWIIGTGLFDNWVYSTDIGYCRFILYCGVIGFGVFALFFIYNALIFAQRYREYNTLFIAFLLLTFIIWIKVATDILLIYALFYCMNYFQERKENEAQLIA